MLEKPDIQDEKIIVILYPFVEGRNGYEVDLSDRHWREFGAALKRIHTAQVPPALLRRIQRETYSPQWREMVKTFHPRHCAVLRASIVDR